MDYLVELLEKETTVYSEYLELAVKKKQALVENDIDELDKIAESEKDLSTKVLALEAARVEFLRENGYASDITLDELIPKLSEADGNKVRETATNLKDILSECKKFNDRNVALLKQSSNYINHMIKVFTSNLNGGRQAATYSKQGGQQFESGRLADMQG